MGAVRLSLALAVLMVTSACGETFTSFAGTSGQGGSSNGGGGASSTSSNGSATTGSGGASTSSTQSGSTTTSSTSGTSGTTSTFTGACDEIPAPASPSCPEICTSCEAGTCNIELKQIGQYQNKKLECPPNMHCYVHCAVKDSCNNTQIVCPEKFACSTRCSGGWGCQNAQIHCGTTGVCALSCGGGVEVCKNTNLNCGLQKCTAKCTSLTDPDPVVHCGQACQCQKC